MTDAKPLSDLPYYQLYINGEWSNASNEAAFVTIEPATGEPLARLAEASASDVDRAVLAARQAFDHGPWPHTPASERVQILHAIADALEEQTDLLTELEARDSGATLRKTTFIDIPLGIEHLRTFAELGRRHPYEPLPWVDMPSVSWNFVWREPIGVCAQITPWNFPFLALMWKLGPALVTGNCVVLKPSPLAPLSTMAVTKIIDDLKLLPKGVLNVINGDVETGEALVAHPGIDKVAFTGSSAVGRKVMTSAAQTLKRVSLELGGKSPSIVLPDADLDIVTDGVLFGSFLHAGQYCESGTRCFVPRHLHDEFVDRLVSRITSANLGDPLDLMTDIGPLISEKQRERVEAYIKLGLEEGATLVCGGGRPTNPELRGPYVEPTIFSNVDNKSRLAQEEIFGPVLAVIPYDSITQAIEMANDSIYGLGGAVWSRDLQQAIEVAKRIRTGTVWINDHHLINAIAPFGGYKQSGIGRELGLAGLNDYTQEKHIHVDLMQKRDGRIWWDTLLP
jgi:acyl-CoA reductase-like NAD-dependent aldehyde dehydrogenase